MATNYVQPGCVLTLTAPAGGVVSGSVYKIGSLIVVALADADAGDEFEGQTDGVFTVVKASGTAWTEGVKLYWDDTNSNFTTVSTSNTACGYATAAATSAATSGNIRLTQLG